MRLKVAPRETPVQRELSVKDVSIARAMHVLNPYSGSQHWDLFRDGVTQGYLAAFLDCPEKIHLGLVHGWTQRVKHGALQFGSIVHDCLENIYRTYSRAKYVSKGNLTEVVLWTLKGNQERDERKMLEKHGGLTPRVTDLAELREHYGLAEVLLPAYFHNWVKDFSNFEWQELEHEFRVPYSCSKFLGLDLPDIPLRGKRDGVFRTNRKLWLFETKTKSRIEEDNLADQIPMNLQVNLYLTTMALDYGEWPAGTVYNIIRKPGLRRGATEPLRDYLSRVREDVEKRPSFYFVRFNVAVTEDELRAWQHQLHGIMRSLVSWYQGDWHYRNPSACTGRRGVCGFLPVCARNEYAGLELKETPFPELQEGEAE